MVHNYDAVTGTDSFLITYNLAQPIFTETFLIDHCHEALQFFKYPSNTLRCEQFYGYPKQPFKRRDFPEQNQNYSYHSDPYDDLSHHTWLTSTSGQNKYRYNPFQLLYRVPRSPPNLTIRSYKVTYSVPELVLQPIRNEFTDSLSKIEIYQRYQLDPRKRRNQYFGSKIQQHAFVVYKPSLIDYTCEARKEISHHCSLSSYSLHCAELDYAWYSYSFGPMCEVLLGMSKIKLSHINVTYTPKPLTYIDTTFAKLYSAIQLGSAFKIVVVLLTPCVPQALPQKNSTYFTYN